jgi:3-dehydroquinate synthase II
MRELWVEIENSMPDKLKEDLLKASEELCTGIVAFGEDVQLVKSHGNLLASPVDGDIQVIEESMINQIETLKSLKKPLCLRLMVKDRGGEAKAVEAADRGVDSIIILCPDWKVIPIENLIAETRGKTKLLAEVSNSKEAEVALEALELGVDGVVLKTDNPKEIESTSRVLKSIEAFSKAEEAPQTVELKKAKIVSCRQLSMGLRACIDTCDLMTHGEGMLVGCRSSGLFLIQAEVQENPHVEPRPFRVNAGPVSLYILTPSNKTRYLSELKAGDEVLAVNREGGLRRLIVGRVKIERRPLTLVEADVEGSRIKTIVQNAETIRFVTKDGSKSVVELKPDDEVLAYHQPGGRHFGVLVGEESVIER